MDVFNAETALNHLSVAQCAKVLTYFKTKSRNQCKIEFVSSLLGDGVFLKDLKVRVLSAEDRFKTVVGKALWEYSSAADGVFDIEILKEKVKEIQDFKRGQEAANAMNV